MLRWMLTCLFSVATSLATFSAFAASDSADAGKGNSNDKSATPFYRITVVDEQTGRGIPMVKLKTTNSTEYWTDSAGVVAFMEPEMMGTQVQMTVETYGYSVPRNMFGAPTIGFIPKAGESMVVKMHRETIGQRLYRITGTDIYRDSKLLGDETFVTQDPSMQPIVGMDSVVTAIYKGKMHWIWGDTGVTATNLGNFRSTGATSALPGEGLDPEKGIYLTFFRDKSGRPRAMVNTDHNLTWMGGMHVVKDKDGKEHLFASYHKIKAPLTEFEAGLLKYNDETDQYDIVWAYPQDANVRLGTNHFRHTDNGVEYFYQTQNFPMVRCKADADSIKDIYSYEGLTCLKEGSKFNESEDQLTRDDQGNLIWGWRKNTTPMSPHQINKLVEKKLATPADAPYALKDASTSASVAPHGGSVYWNEYRKRWVAITLQTFGTSWLGEVWCFEGDTPNGPWVYGEKIVTHTIFRNPKGGGQRVDEAAQEAAETYGFYNVKHHPEFDKENGRVIYLEGTYTMQFSGAKIPTPRYNYNQLMYKVELDDPRLRLPVPVYRVSGKTAGYFTKANLPEKVKMDKDAAIPFFAPDTQREGTVPVYMVAANKGVQLALEKPADDAAPAFFAAPPEAEVTTATIKATVPLYEYTNSKTGERFYSVKESLAEKNSDKAQKDSDGKIDEVPANAADFQRADNPVCRVWPNPIRFNPYRIKG